MALPWIEPGIWVAALFTLAIYSFLVKDNPFYKLVEHIYVGVSTGYLLVVALTDALKRDLYDPLFVLPHKEYIVIIPGLLGLLLLARVFPKITPYSRISIAFFIGVTAGVQIPNNIQATLLKQSEATLIPLYSLGDSWFDVFTHIVILVGVLAVLIYFFYSIKHEGLVKPVSRVGVFYLMIFFGAGFGYTVMGRVSLLIGRMRFLLIDWLGIGG